MSSTWKPLRDQILITYLVVERAIGRNAEELYWFNKWTEEVREVEYLRCCWQHEPGKGAWMSFRETNRSERSDQFVTCDCKTDQKKAKNEARLVKLRGETGSRWLEGVERVLALRSTRRRGAGFRCRRLQATAASGRDFTARRRKSGCA